MLRQARGLVPDGGIVGGGLHRKRPAPTAPGRRRWLSGGAQRLLMFGRVADKGVAQPVTIRASRSASLIRFSTRRRMRIAVSAPNPRTTLSGNSCDSPSCAATQRPAICARYATSTHHADAVIPHERQEHDDAGRAPHQTQLMGPAASGSSSTTGKLTRLKASAATGVGRNQIPRVAQGQAMVSARSPKATSDRQASGTTPNVNRLRTPRS